jgi:hypothetical protein
MNEFLSNNDRHFYNNFEYKNRTYIRESHGGIRGVHWHRIFNNIKSPLILDDKELEQQFQREMKLKRVLKGDKDVLL